MLVQSTIFIMHAQLKKYNELLIEDTAQFMFGKILRLTLERPTKICSVEDQPGLIGPLSTFFAKALFYNYFFPEWPLF